MNSVEDNIWWKFRCLSNNWQIFFFSPQFRCPSNNLQIFFTPATNYCGNFTNEAYLPNGWARTGCPCHWVFLSFSMLRYANKNTWEGGGKGRTRRQGMIWPVGGSQLQINLDHQNAWPHYYHSYIIQVSGVRCRRLQVATWTCEAFLAVASDF